MIRNFNEIGKNDVEIVGGKGANLGEMTRAGINVPQGFVITSKAYKAFLCENSIENEIHNLSKKVEGYESEVYNLAENIRNEIKQGKFPKEVEKAIKESYEKMCRDCNTDVRVAVRSSATAEDLPDASFAGQQETYLNVKGIDLLLAKVKECYASLWGNRAISYRKNQGYNQESVSLAVVVQEMIESEKAGVLFTVNPVNNNRNEIQINASYGLGEAVVSGMVTPDTYICDKNGNIKDSVLGSKSLEVIYSEKGMTKEEDVDEERSKRLCLSRKEIKNLCNAGVNIERHYKNPMDIEWAIRKNEVYILQARAVTTLNSNIDEKIIEKYIKKNKVTGIMRKNITFILEKIPVAYYPMDYGFFSAINNSKEEVLSKVGIEVSMAPRIDDNGIMVLPSNEKKINKKVFNIVKTIRKFKNLDYCKNKCDEKINFYKKKVEEISSFDYSSLSLEECAVMTQKIVETVKELAYSRFYYALFPAALISSKIEKKIKKVDKSLTSFDLCSNLNFKTAVISKEISELAEIISDDADLKNDILLGKDYKEVCNKYPKISIKFDQFMCRNGMKSDFNCYCLYAKSFKEDPNRLLNIIKPLIGNHSGYDEEKFIKIMNKLRESYDERKFNKLKNDISYLRYFHIIREESQYLWETLYYYGRMVIKHAALLSFGDEDYTNNLAYLFINEFIDMAMSGKVTDDVKKKIERRKNNGHIAEEVWKRSKACVFEESGEILKGVSGSEGKAVGRACIVRGPEEFYKLKKGDILICPLTDPEWTPLFKVASAIIADTGGALSHAAIVAREYNVPAVLGVGVATSRYKDGDKVCVDGSKGEVFLVE